MYLDDISYMILRIYLLNVFTADVLINTNIDYSYEIHLKKYHIVIRSIIFVDIMIRLCSFISTIYFHLKDVSLN